MDNLSDPRAVRSDDELDRLTDDESWVNESDKRENRNKEELLRVTARLQEIDREKAAVEKRIRELRAELGQRKGVQAESQVAKTPSPKKAAVEDTRAGLRPQNLGKKLGSAMEAAGTEAGLPQRPVDSTKSYFVKLLQESKETHSQQVDEQAKFMKSRTYTFDSLATVEPFAVDEKEHFSGQWITKRYFKHEQLSEYFANKKILRLGKLFAKVTPPHFTEPQYANWAVVGIICKKTDPRNTSDNRSRFLTIALTDFKFTVDIKIFGKAIEKYIKLRVGDVVAILNPGIWSFSAQGPGRLSTFNLNIKNDGDSILEIGKSKNFGVCQITKRSGGICGVPIDKSVEQCCNYHNEIRINKTASKRLEFSGTYSMRNPTKNGTKQQVLMGDMHSKRGAAGMMIDDRYAPKIDRISNSIRANFSNAEAGRAFFNENFENVEAVKLQREKRRKLDQRDKEMELREKLSKLNGGQSLRKKAELRDQDRKSLETKKALFKQAFPQETLSAIGFDPTSSGGSSSKTGLLALSEKSKPSNEVSELESFKNILKNKTIDLKPSKEQIAKKRQLNRETLETLNRIHKKPAANSAAGAKNVVTAGTSADGAKNVVTAGTSADGAKNVVTAGTRQAGTKNVLTKEVLSKLNLGVKRGDGGSSDDELEIEL